MNNGGGGTLAGFEVRHIRHEALINQRFVFFIDSLYCELLTSPSVSTSSPSASIRILVASTKRSISYACRSNSSSTSISLFGVFMGLFLPSKWLVDVTLVRLIKMGFPLLLSVGMYQEHRPIPLLDR